MNAEDIARMAEEAGMMRNENVWFSKNRFHIDVDMADLERFAKLVAAAERNWQGLTAEDLAEIPPSCYEGAIWADARLKEKNT